MEKELNPQKSANETVRPPFLTVCEISKYRTAIYVTEEHVLVQDHEDKNNCLVIPLQTFKDRSHATLHETQESQAESTNEDTTTEEKRFDANT